VREREGTGGAEAHGRRAAISLTQGGEGVVASQEASGAPAVCHTRGRQSAGTHESRGHSTCGSRSPADVEEEFGEL
jgi:hypothetical protein